MCPRPFSGLFGIKLHHVHTRACVHAYTVVHTHPTHPHSHAHTPHTPHSPMTYTVMHTHHTHPTHSPCAVAVILVHMQNAIWSALGVNIGFGQKFSPVQQACDAYPPTYGHTAPRTPCRIPHGRLQPPLEKRAENTQHEGAMTAFHKGTAPLAPRSTTHSTKTHAPHATWPRSWVSCSTQAQTVIASAPPHASTWAIFWFLPPSTSS